MKAGMYTNALKKPSQKQIHGQIVVIGSAIETVGLVYLPIAHIDFEDSMIFQLL